MAGAFDDIDQKYLNPPATSSAFDDIDRRYGATEPEAPSRGLGGFLADTVKDLAAGSNVLVRHGLELGRTAEASLERNIPMMAMLKRALSSTEPVREAYAVRADALDRAGQALNEGTAYWQEQQSPQLQQKRSARAALLPVYSKETGFAPDRIFNSLENPSLLASDVLQSAPEMAAIMATSGAGMQTRLGQLVAQGVPEAAARQVMLGEAAAANIGASGLAGGSSAAAQARDEVLDMGMPADQRSAMAEDAAGKAFAVATPLGMLAARLGAGGEAQLATRQLDERLLPMIALQTLDEGTQGGSEQLGTNVGLKYSGAQPGLDLSEGVADNAAMEALAGGAMGAGMWAGGKLTRQPDAAAPPGGVSQQQASDLVDAVKQAAEQAAPAAAPAPAEQRQPTPDEVFQEDRRVALQERKATLESVEAGRRTAVEQARATIADPEQLKAAEAEINDQADAARQAAQQSFQQRDAAARAALKQAMSEVQQQAGQALDARPAASDLTAEFNKAAAAVPGSPESIPAPAAGSLPAAAAMPAPQANMQPPAPDMQPDAIDMQDLPAQPQAAPQPQVQPVSRPQPRRAAVAPIDPLHVAVRKLGGLRRAEALADAYDRADMNSFPRSTFARDGRSMDELAEALAELGYPVRDENGRADPRLVDEHLRAAVRGDEVYTPDGEYARMDREQAQRQQEQDELDAMDEADDIPGFDSRPPLTDQGERPPFRKGPETRAGFTIDQTQQTVDEITRGWRNLPPIRVIDAVPGVPRAKGYIHRGEVVIAAGAHRSRDDLRQTIEHEVLGHYAQELRGTEAMRKVLQAVQVLEKNGHKVAKSWAAHVDRLQPGLRPVVRAEEMLVRAVETGEYKAIPALLQKIRDLIATLREFLRRDGHPAATWEDSKLLQEVYAAVREGRRLVEKGGVPATAPTQQQGLARYAKSDGTGGVADRGKPGVDYGHGQELLQSRLLQWASDLNLDGRGGIGLVAQEWAEPSRYAGEHGSAGFTAQAEEGRAEQERLIAAAKDHGFFFDDTHPIFDALTTHKNEGGAEHDAYIVGEPQNRLVIRSTIPGSFGNTSTDSPVQYLKRLETYNQLFPNLQVRLIGVGQHDDGTATIWTAQQFVPGEEYASQAELDAAMRARGWFEVGTNTNKYRHKATGAVIEDVHRGNVLHDGDKLYPIDVIVEKLPQDGADIRFRKGDADRQNRPGKAANLGFGTDEAGDRVFKPGVAAYEKLAGALRKLLGEKAREVLGGGWSMANTSPAAFRQLMRQYIKEFNQAQSSAVDIGKKGQPMSEAERALLSDVLEKELKAGVVPPAEIEAIAVAMRDALNRQTAELVELGMLSQESADRWRDTYLPRIYKKAANDDLAKESFKVASRMKVKGDHLKGRGIFKQIDPTKQGDFEKLGWEKRADGEDGPIMWRDFSKEEREKMGENRDAIERFIRGFLHTQRDIATARLLQRVAENPELASEGKVEGWPRVPQDEIASTGGMKKYGNLAGMYVHPEVWEQLKYQIDDRTEVERLYRHALNVWKEGKTVLNPVSHTNNVISNVLLATAAGANAADMARGIRSYQTKDSFYKEAVDAGLLGTEYYGADIKAILGEDVKGDMRPMNFATRWLRGAGQKAWRNPAFEGMRKLFDMEDAVFKVVLYRRAREGGMTPEQAIDYAEAFVFNYSDLPAGVKKLRDYAIPFISYTYKAVPAMARLALTRPHRMLSIVGAIYGLNALAFMSLGPDGDEEEERKVMPEYQKGFALWGVPKLIRMPVNLDGKATYLDIYRWVPLGDFVDTGNDSAGADLPSWATPGGPFWDAYNVISNNRDTFTGRDFFEETDTDYQKFKKAVHWQASQWVPMYYHAKKNLDALRNQVDGDSPMGKTLDTLGFSGMDRRGNPVTQLPAALGSVGVKVRTFDPDEERMKRDMEVSFDIKRIRSAMRSEQRDMSIPAARRDELAKQREAQINALDPSQAQEE